MKKKIQVLVDGIIKTRRSFLSDKKQKLIQYKTKLFYVFISEQTWDKDLAVGAKEWAQQCLFVESDPWKLGRYEGENLWAGTDPAHFNATSAIQEWADERQHYDYYCWNCKKVCDHYIKVRVLCCLWFLCINQVRKQSQCFMLVLCCSTLKDGAG